MGVAGSWLSLAPSVFCAEQCKADHCDRLVSGAAQPPAHVAGSGLSPRSHCVIHLQPDGSQVLSPARSALNRADYKTARMFLSVPGKDNREPVIQTHKRTTTKAPQRMSV